MPDVANLQIKVDITDLKNARIELKDLSKASTDASKVIIANAKARGIAAREAAATAAKEETLLSRARVQAAKESAALTKEELRLKTATEKAAVASARAELQMRKLSTSSAKAASSASFLTKRYAAAASQLGAFAAAYISVQSAVKAVNYTISTTDELIGLETRLKAATEATGDFNEVYSRLVKSSSDVGVELAGNVALFQNLARVLPETGATNDEILTMIESINKLGIISGVSATDLKFAMRQFSQAMAAGVVRAEEFNSIVENTPELAYRIAKGMGTTLGQLRLLVLEGKVLSKDVFESILGQTEEIDADFEKVPRRMGMAASELKNTFQQVMGSINDTIGVTNQLVSGMENFTGALNLAQDAASSLSWAVENIGFLAGGIFVAIERLSISEGLDAAVQAWYETTEKYKKLNAEIDTTRDKISIINQLIRDRDWKPVALIDIDLELEKANVVDDAYQRIMDKIELRGKTEQETVDILFERASKKLEQMNSLGLDTESVNLRNKLYGEYVDLLDKAESIQGKIDKERQSRIDEAISSYADLVKQIDAEGVSKLKYSEQILLYEEQRKAINESLLSIDDSTIEGMEKKVELTRRLFENQKNLSRAEAGQASQQDEFGSFVAGIKGENQSAESAYQERIDMIESYREEMGLSDAAYHEASLEAFAAFERAKTAEAMEQASVRKQINEEFIMGALDVASQATELMSEAAEEGSAIQKAMFAISKGIAFANAIVNANAAYTMTLGTDKAPTEARIAKAEMVRTLGYASAGLIAAQTLVGLKEHGGMIPSGQSAIVGEAGPEFVRGPAYVTSARTTEALMSSKSGNSGNNISVNVQNKAGGVVKANATTSRLGDKELINITIDELTNRIAKGGNRASNTFDRLYSSRRGKS